MKIDVEHGVIERDTNEAPFGKLVIAVGQRRERGALDGLEQLAPTETEPRMT